MAQIQSASRAISLGCRATGKRGVGHDTSGKKTDPHDHQHQSEQSL
jgi:hypothetical protein